MPEIGGKRLAADFSSMMADVRRSIETSKSTLAAAIKELQIEIEEGGAEAAKAIKAEAAEVRKGYEQLLGNNPPSEDGKS
jgi:hypothetical protein